VCLSRTICCIWRICLRPARHGNGMTSAAVGQGDRASNARCRRCSARRHNRTRSHRRRRIDPADRPAFPGRMALVVIGRADFWSVSVAQCDWNASGPVLARNPRSGRGIGAAAGHGGPAGRGRREPLTVICPSRTLVAQGLHYLSRGSEHGGASRLTRRMRVHA